MASATSSPSSPIPNISTLVSVKLSESNYLPWESQVKPFLIGQNFWRFVDGTHPCPPSFLTTTTHATSPNASADSASSTVVPPVTTSIPNPDYLKGTKTISDYLGLAKHLADQLASIGQPVQNDDLVTYVLNGLGPEYEILVLALTNFPHLPSFNDLRARLLVYESKHAMSQAILAPSAFYSARNSGSNLSQGRGNLSSRPHGTSSNNRLPRTYGGGRSTMHGGAGRYGQCATHQRPGILGPGPATRGPQCWSCNQFGHIAALCPRAPRSDDDIS
ncbi:uncharacterized protein LOC126618194 [Malus sylvestris]|uniref:uncharacterized protein LOC126618194 n=1 Tax=Malus sylvestris TaxID=3752 RepID=UPI0021ABC5CD|nr:uncharacterized protein LOC126618194 [Malus sylvestris]